MKSNLDSRAIEYDSEDRFVRVVLSIIVLGSIFIFSCYSILSNIFLNHSTEVSSIILGGFGLFLSSIMLVLIYFFSYRESVRIENNIVKYCRKYYIPKTISWHESINNYLGLYPTIIRDEERLLTTIFLIHSKDNSKNITIFSKEISFKLEDVVEAYAKILLLPILKLNLEGKHIVERSIDNINRTT